MEKIEFKTKLGEILDTKKVKRPFGTRPLSIIILGLLSKKNMHGYELLKNMHFLIEKPTYSQLYPLLHEMEEKGLIKGKWKKRKKIYSLTKEGRKAAEEGRGVFKKIIIYLNFIYKKIF